MARIQRFVKYLSSHRHLEPSDLSEPLQGGRGQPEPEPGQCDGQQDIHCITHPE